MTPEGSLQPCERFTVLESRQNENVLQCDVCDHFEAAHEGVGRRTLSGGEIEELRRRILIERHDQLQQERHRDDGPINPRISGNGDPELH